MTTDIMTRIHFLEIHSSANSKMIFLTDYNGNLSTTTLMIMKTIRVLKKELIIPMMIVMVVLMTKISTPIQQDRITETTMMNTQWNPRQVVQYCI